MHYKTICLDLIQQRPRLVAELRKDKRTLSTVEMCARALKDCHEAWKLRLAESHPTSDPASIASQALELAVAAMQEALPSESAPSDREAISLDELMARLRLPMPTA